MRALPGLLIVLLVLVSCAPLPPATPSPASTLQPTLAATPLAPPLPATPAPTAAPTVAASAPSTAPAPAGWQTYTAAGPGFSIAYPPGWTQTQMPADSGQNMQGVALDGPEGHIELQWGTGFGGACMAYSALHIADGQISACHTVWADGTQHWEQIYKQLLTTSFGARALTNNADQASADAVLDVLATLSFGAATPTPAAAASEGEIVVDNAGPDFWPKGDWYYLDTPQKYGEDCYVALPGLHASGEVRPELPSAGFYEVFARWCGNPNYDQTSHGVIEVHRSPDDPAPQSVGVNYQAGAGEWQSLGTYDLEPDALLAVKSVIDGNVVADAFKFVPSPQDGIEVVPTPLPTGPIVTNHPPSPLEQLTAGDLTARLGMTDPFYTSMTITSTQQTFDDCQAFPRDGCSGTRDGWEAIVTHQPITLTYRVSSDYKFVGVQGADVWLDPTLMGQQYPQRVYLNGTVDGKSFKVRFNPDSAWRLLRPANGSTPASDTALTADQVATIRDLTPKYSTLHLQSDTGSLDFYGFGPVVAPSDADLDALFALATALVASPQ